KQRYITRNFRPRSDQTHFAAQHVNKLRKFVYLRFSQYSTDSRDPGIFSNRELSTLQRSVRNHGSKFPYEKRPQPFADPLLPKKDRPAGIKLDEQCGYPKNRRQSDQ